MKVLKKKVVEKAKLGVADILKMVEQKKLPARYVKFLKVLQELAGEDGWCRAKTETIADAVGWTENTVFVSIAGLRKLGLIEVKKESYHSRLIRVLVKV